MRCDDCPAVEAGEATCAICGAVLADVLCLGHAPIANQLRDHDTDPILTHACHVAACSLCTTVQLVSRPSAAVLFDDSYPYRSSQSLTMVRSAATLARYMTQALNLGGGDRVFEIGSNDGYLLRHYLRDGVAVHGFDPAVGAAEDARLVGVDTTCVHFDSEVGRAFEGKARVVHAHNVLAHVDDPDDVVAGIARLLTFDGVAVIETPWLAALLDAGAFDTIYHEHRFYWSVRSLAALLARHGLSVMGIEHLPDLHGGSVRLFASKVDGWSIDVAHTLAGERLAGLDQPSAWARRFAIIHRGQVETLRRWFEQVDPVAGYGAAAKAAVLLHVLDVAGPRWVVDSTPAKQGKWTPSGALVLPPDALDERVPGDCVVFPWNFADEIAGKAQRYVASGGRLWALMPNVRRL